MNRKQKRDFVRQVRKKGVSKSTAEAFIAIQEAGLGKPSFPQHIVEGDKVRIDLEKVKARKNHDKMSANYKEFVENNADKVFTAHVERPNLISFVEAPAWLFWSGDLIKVGDENKEAQDAAV